MLYIGSSPVSQVPQGIRQLFDVFHEQVAYWLVSQGLSGQTPTHDHMVSALLKGDASPVEAKRYLAGLGWSEACVKYVMILRIPTSNPSIHRIMARHLDALRPKVIHSSRGDSFTIAGNSEAITDEALLSGMQPMIRKYDVDIGISSPFEDARHFKDAYRQAELATDYAKTYGCKTCHCHEHAVSLLGGLLRLDSSSCLRHPAISLIQNHDAAHGTELLDTLRSYLLNERSLVHTAAELNVHKNTVKYRIRAIEELFDVDLDNREQRLYLTVSLALEL